MDNDQHYANYPTGSSLDDLKEIACQKSVDAIYSVEKYKITDINV